MQLASSQNFNFMNYKKKKPKKVFYKILKWFLFFQLLLTGYQAYQWVGFVENIAAENEKSFMHFDNYKKALETGNEKEILLQFKANLTQGYTINDLLNSLSMTNIQGHSIYRVSPEYDEKSDIFKNLKESTKEKLITLYKENRHQGYMNEMKYYKEAFSCNVINLSCYLMRSHADNLINITKSKAQKADYHALHFDEFYKWKTQNLNNKRDDPSPADIMFNK